MELLALLYFGAQWGLPNWLTHLIAGVLLTYWIALAGFIVARTGRSPLWALAFVPMFLPSVVLAAGVWLLAYVRWPGIDGPASGDAESGRD